MTIPIIVRPAADADIDEAHDWYERKQAGLGKSFVSKIDEAMEKLRRSPDLGIVVHKQLRRLAVDRFPYGVFYLVEAQRIVVVGVIHGRRAPRVWKRRLA
ncbi:MAG: type II toxin-antitoxin system RelE/ParE family toxin [Planctomycetaceae bacterium]|nr:type II toxin-antitoxin system RelE/ParE family toxin [Planctomycetaceae bacterium]